MGVGAEWEGVVQEVVAREPHQVAALAALGFETATLADGTRIEIQAANYKPWPPEGEQAMVSGLDPDVSVAREGWAGTQEGWDTVAEAGGDLGDGDVPEDGWVDGFGPVDGAGGGLVPIGTPVGLPAVTTLTAILARVSARYGPQVAALLGRVIRALGPVGTRLSVVWARIPAWGKVLLGYFGVSAVSDILIDTGPDDRGLIQLPGFLGGLPDAPGLGEPGSIIMIGARAYAVASTWQAGQVTFYRFTDGHLGVQNKHGVWKVWLPKKPIVIFADGPNDLKTALRADKALGRLSTEVGSMLRRRGFQVRRKIDQPTKKMPK